MLKRLRKRKGRSSSETVDGLSGKRFSNRHRSDDGYAYILPTPGPHSPSFPLKDPARSVYKIVKSEYDGYTPQQLKYLVKEWAKLETERSVCYNVKSLSEALENANNVWSRIDNHDTREFKIRFSNSIKKTRGELLDEMEANPRGILCQAIQDFDGSDGFRFCRGDMVLKLSVDGNTCDGIANGVRGHFRIGDVVKLPNQPADLSFMWLNVGRPTAMTARVAGTFDIVSNTDDYFNINDDDDEDDDDEHMDDQANQNSEIDRESVDCALGNTSVPNDVRDVEFMLYGGESSESSEDEPFDDRLDSDSSDRSGKAIAQPRNSIILSPPHSTDAQIGDDYVDIDSNDSEEDEEEEAHIEQQVVEEEGEDTSNYDGEVQGPWGKAIMSPPPLRRSFSGSSFSRQDPGTSSRRSARRSQQDLEYTKKDFKSQQQGTNWFSQASLRKKKSIKLTTPPIQVPTVVTSEFVSAAASSSIAGELSTASRDLRTLGMRSNFWRRSFLLRSNKDSTSTAIQASPYNERSFMFVKKCIDEMHSKGVDEEGIYRIAGQSSKISALFETFVVKQKDVEFSQYDIPTLSSAVKYFFRTATKPLLTPYSSWLYAVRSSEKDTVERAKSLKDCFQSLPWPNQAVLNMLLHHLRLVMMKSDVNKMTASNIGVVFGPTLLRPVESGNVDALADVPQCAQVVASLISQLDEIGNGDAVGDVQDDGLGSELGDLDFLRRQASLNSLASMESAASFASGFGDSRRNSIISEEGENTQGISFVGGHATPALLGSPESHEVDQKRLSTFSFGSGFGEIIDEEESEDASESINLHGDNCAKTVEGVPRGRLNRKNRPTSVYGFDGLLSPEFLSSGNQEGIAEESIEAIPESQDQTEEEGEIQNDEDFSSDEYNEEERKKGYMQISFRHLRKKDGQATTSGIPDKRSAQYHEDVDRSDAYLQLSFPPKEPEEDAGAEDEMRSQAAILTAELAALEESSSKVGGSSQAKAAAILAAELDATTISDGADLQRWKFPSQRRGSGPQAITTRRGSVYGFLPGMDETNYSDEDGC